MGTPSFTPFELALRKNPDELTQSEREMIIAKSSNLTPEHKVKFNSLLNPSNMDEAKVPGTEDTQPKTPTTPEAGSEGTETTTPSTPEINPGDSTEPGNTPDGTPEGVGSPEKAEEDEDSDEDSSDEDADADKTAQEQADGQVAA